jgi:hypothetical protein
LAHVCLLFFNYLIFTRTTRCSRLILHISCLSCTISYFSKESWNAI